MDSPIKARDAKTGRSASFTRSSKVAAQKKGERQMLIRKGDLPDEHTFSK